MKTNRQVLKKAVEQLTEMQLVILRERILTICEDVLENKEEIMQMKNSIIHPQLYIESIEAIKEKIDFNEA
jgi:hypothetical protein